MEYKWLYIIVVVGAVVFAASVWVVKSENAEIRANPEKWKVVHEYPD